VEAGGRAAKEEYDVWEGVELQNHDTGDGWMTYDGGLVCIGTLPNS
jgi:hypothetical protein